MTESYIIRPPAGWEVYLVEDGEEKLLALAATEKQALKYVREYIEESSPKKTKKAMRSKAKK